MNGKAGQNNTSWGDVAGWYDELLETSPDSYQAKVILPNIVRLMDIKPGQTVLDVACGQGYFSRIFAKQEAKVTGCDISPELIAVAKDRSPKDIIYKVSSSHLLEFASSNSFDFVTIILAIQNIENLSATISECARVLRPGGRMLMVLNHPAFRIPTKSGWEWDEKKGKQYRRIDAYLSDSRFEIDMTPGTRDPMRRVSTLSFHRPLQVYVKAMHKAGLAVSRLEEWISHKKSEKGPRGAEEDRVRKEIPLFLMLESVKLQTNPTEAHS